GNLRLVERRSPVAMGHHDPMAAAEAMVQVQRGAKRGAVVASRGLDVHVAERGLLANLAVGYAVHRAATSQAEPIGPARRMDGSEHRECGLFVHGLQRRRNGLMPRLQRLVAATGWPEQGFELRGEDGTECRLSFIP